MAPPAGIFLSMEHITDKTSGSYRCYNPHFNCMSPMSPPPCSFRSSPVVDCRASLSSDEDEAIKTPFQHISSASSRSGNSREDNASAIIGIPVQDVHSPQPQSEEKVKGDVLNDVNLAPQSNKQPQLMPASGDTDFLQDLDDLDFDFDDIDPLCDMPFQNNMQSFIDTTLYDDIDNDSSSSSIGMEDLEEEDEYRKEFFMKHLGLEKVAHDSTQRINRKRKYEQISDNSSSGQLQLLSTNCKVSYSGVCNDGRGTHYTPLPSSSQHSIVCTGITPPPPPPTTTAAATTTTRHIVPTQVPGLSVPYKVCSCSSTDWQGSVLYSTARSSAVTSPRTSASTASSSSSPRQHTHGHNVNTPAASTHKLKVSTTASLVDFLSGCSDESNDNNNDNYNLIECSNRDEILDKEAEEILSWLDSQDVQTTIYGGHAEIATPALSTTISISNKCSSNFSSDMEAVKINETSLAHQHTVIYSNSEDLESYLSDDYSSSISTPVNKLPPGVSDSISVNVGTGVTNILIDDDDNNDDDDSQGRCHKLSPDSAPLLCLSTATSLAISCRDRDLFPSNHVVNHKNSSADSGANRFDAYSNTRNDNSNDIHTSSILHITQPTFCFNMIDPIPVSPKPEELSRSCCPRNDISSSSSTFMITTPSNRSKQDVFDNNSFSSLSSLSTSSSPVSSPVSRCSTHSPKQLELLDLFADENCSPILLEGFHESICAHTHSHTHLELMA